MFNDRTTLLRYLRYLAYRAKTHAVWAKEYRESAAKCLPTGSTQEFFIGLAKGHEGTVNGIRIACRDLALQRRLHG